MSDVMNRNPYSKAADAYGHTAATVDPRALEGKVLLKAASKLEALAKRLGDGENVHFTEVGETLEYNQKLWMLFVDDARNPEHPLPQELKNNIATLGLYVFKRTRDLLIEPKAEKFRVLIDINRNIAAGLMKKTAAAPSSPAPPARGDGGKTDSMA